MAEGDQSRHLAKDIHKLLMERDWAAAEEALGRYVELQPNDPKGWFLRAFTAWALGNHSQAEDYVRRALRIYPGYRRARELKERLAHDSASPLSDNVDLDSKTFLGHGAGGVSPPQSADDFEDTIPLQTPAGGVRVVAGRYRLDTLLGSGGMGHVWRAHDLRLHDRVVAVKRIHPHLLTAPEALARFQGEVEALAGLNHPYIVGVLDSGRDDEGCYCVMEYVEGATLRKWLTQHEPETWPAYGDVLNIFTQVCRAVAFAHSHEIIHRDLKPENVIITPDKAVQILDFGLASCLGREGMTVAGKTVGTPLYMAPEQLRGEQPDPRWDVYALGVVLFELLTLRRPWEGDNLMEIARERAENPPPTPRNYRPDLPEAIERILLKTLSRDPQARYASPRDLVTEVQQTLTALLPTRHDRNSERILHQLAEAAWLDGYVSEQEREFLLERAEELGIPRERACEIVGAARPG